MISVDQASQLLLSEEVVALPTETVYGLAGRCDSKEALERIFATKKRPFFDPLILHVKDLEQARLYGKWDSVSEKLAQKFWPGPLTLVLPKTKNVLPTVNNGMDTVALRCPRHEKFLEVLDQLPCALAAPSANRFGKTSPTSAEHVLSEFEGKVAVVDGGPTETGIESTVIQFDEETQKVRILRPGLITDKDLNEATSLAIEWTSAPKENSPGHLKDHYQPDSLLVLLFTDDMTVANDHWKKFLNVSSELKKWNLPNDPALAARSLYSDLRQFSQTGQPVFIELKSLQTEDPLWRALLDRLTKASHFQFQWTGSDWVPLSKY